MAITTKKHCVMPTRCNLCVGHAVFQRRNVALLVQIVSTSHRNTITSKNNCMVVARRNLGVELSSIQWWNFALSLLYPEARAWPSLRSSTVCRWFPAIHSTAIASEKHSPIRACSNHCKMKSDVGTRSTWSWAKSVQQRLRQELFFQTTKKRIAWWVVSFSLGAGEFPPWGSGPVSVFTGSPICRDSVFQISHVMSGSMFITCIQKALLQLLQLLQALVVGFLQVCYALQLCSGKFSPQHPSISATHSPKVQTCPTYLHPWKSCERFHAILGLSRTKNPASSSHCLGNWWSMPGSPHLHKPSWLWVRLGYWGPEGPQWIHEKSESVSVSKHLKTSQNHPFWSSLIPLFRVIILTITIRYPNVSLMAATPFLPVAQICTCRWPFGMFFRGKT